MLHKDPLGSRWTDLLMGVSRSHCRRAHGIGDTVVAIFEKCHLLWACNGIQICRKRWDPGFSMTIQEPQSFTSSHWLFPVKPRSGTDPRDPDVFSAQVSSFFKSFWACIMSPCWGRAGREYSGGKSMLLGQEFLFIPNPFTYSWIHPFSPPPFLTIKSVLSIIPCSFFKEWLNFSLTWKPSLLRDCPHMVTRNPLSPNLSSHLVCLASLWPWSWSACLLELFP